MFQRSGSTGTIVITGSTGAGEHSIEARWRGGAWSTIATTDPDGTFSASLTAQAEGQGTLEVRRADTPLRITSVPFVGIGDIFALAGQSNSLGQATNAQVYSHATLKAAKFTRAGAWADCTDKVDSSSNSAGSWMPLLATHFLADQSVPCAFVPAGVDGSRIASWNTGGTNYNALLARIAAAGDAAKCILWWQGEGDALDGTTKATYKAALNTLANDLFTATGLRLMPCLLQNCSGIADANEAAINDAIAECIAENDNVLAGPDLRDLNSDDAYHLKSDANNAAAASRWWTALETAFYT